MLRHGPESGAMTPYHMQRDLTSVAGPAEQHNLQSFIMVNVKFLEYDIRALNHCGNSSGDVHEMRLLGGLCNVLAPTSFRHYRDSGTFGFGLNARDYVSRSRRSFCLTSDLTRSGLTTCYKLARLAPNSDSDR